MAPIPIASIIFEGDFRLGVLQALSIDRLYDLDTLSEYVIILNGENNSVLRKKMDAALRSTSREFREKITYLQWQDVLGSTPKVGFYDQQSLKIAVASHFNTDHYILLDSKNHFVAPASADTFFDHGKPIGPLTKTGDYWKVYLSRSARAIGADPGGDWEYMMPSVTPAVMMTDQVLAMSENLKDKYGLPLPAAMEKSKGTEFLLYFAHLRKTGHIDKYVNVEMPYRTLFTNWPQDPSVVALFIREVGEQRPIFGLHRNRLRQLTSEQKTLISGLWSEHLLNEWEEPSWFLDSIE